MLALLLAAVALGFLLIFLIGATDPKLGRRRETSEGLHELDAEELGTKVGGLLHQMGLEVERTSGGPGGLVEILAANPAPVTGGRILVYCVPGGSLGPTGELEPAWVLQLQNAVRDDFLSKGLLFTTGRISDAARAESEGTQIELFDGEALRALLRAHSERTK